MGKTAVFDQPSSAFRITQVTKSLAWCLTREVENLVQSELLQLFSIMASLCSDRKHIKTEGADSR